MRKRSLACSMADVWTTNASLARLEIKPKRRRAPSTPGFVTEDESEDLLKGDPKIAEERARQALETDPGDLQAQYMLGAALHRQKQHASARDLLEPLAESQPHMSFVWRDLGMACVALGDTARGIECLRHAIDMDYLDKDAWYALGDLLPFPGEEPGGRDEPQLIDAENALVAGELDTAETALRGFLEERPEHPWALKLLADALIRKRLWPPAKDLLERCLELAPDFLRARFRCATMMTTHLNYLKALPHFEILEKADPTNMLYRAIKAVTVARSRQLDLAVAAYDSFIHACPPQAGLWLEYARTLRHEDRPDALPAFHRAIELMPSYIAAYTALAFVKSVKLDQIFVDQVLTQLARPQLRYEDRARLHYALGKALEDMKRYGESFEHYAASNDILRRGRKYGVEISTDSTRRAKRFFKPAFLRAHAGEGCPAPDPIFIVGMPRAGSTLVEQILSSHSQIEGLGELSDLSDITSTLGQDEQEHTIPYPFILKKLAPERFRDLGEEYMHRTRQRRRTDKPYFTDKMPGNFSHVALIHLVLPNAKIIDARRHPLDCCFSCFKHYFPAGQPLSTNLRDVGRGYANYVELMAFYEELLPGRVHRVIYEQVVENPEQEVRRMLEYCGLPFEEQCLRFHENKRFVMTISQDQVRMPLYKTGVEQWRRYDPWLGPLKEELGYVLDLYPQVPKYFTNIHGRWSEPLSLGNSSGLFGTVKGVRQIPFETKAEAPALAA